MNKENEYKIVREMNAIVNGVDNNQSKLKEDGDSKRFEELLVLLIDDGRMTMDDLTNYGLPIERHLYCGTLEHYYSNSRMFENLTGKKYQDLIIFGEVIGYDDNGGTISSLPYDYEDPCECDNEHEGYSQLEWVWVEDEDGDADGQEIHGYSKECFTRTERVVKNA